MRRIDKLRRPAERYSFNDWAGEAFSLAGVPYRVFGHGMNVEGPQFAGEDGTSLVQQIHLRHGVVAAAAFARASLMSSTRFQFRRFEDRGLFGSPELLPLERPQDGMTGAQLQTQAELQISYHGNAYFHRVDADTIELLPPEKVAVVRGGDNESNTVPLEYLVFKDRAGVGEPERVISAGSVAHWASLDLHPTMKWFGVSWVSSLAREISQDFQTSQYIDAFYRNGAAPSILVGVPSEFDEEQVNQFAELARREYAGATNAHKMMIVGNGSDVHQLGSKLNDLGLKDLRSEFESRVAARSRVPAVILQVPTAAVTGGSSLNAGNYTTTRRTWHDTWWSPTVQALCACLQRIVPPPPNSELWYDTRDVAFVQEDRTDEASIMQQKASAILSLVNAGYQPDSIVQAVDNNQLALLTHSGLASVQLQPLGETPSDDSGPTLETQP